MATAIVKYIYKFFPEYVSNGFLLDFKYSGYIKFNLQGIIQGSKINIFVGFEKSRLSFGEQSL